MINVQGPTVVTMAESDVAFETSHCGEWVKQRGPPSQSWPSSSPLAAATATAAPTAEETPAAEETIRVQKSNPCDRIVLSECSYHHADC